MTLSSALALRKPTPFRLHPGDQNAAFCSAPAINSRSGNRKRHWCETVASWAAPHLPIPPENWWCRKALPTTWVHQCSVEASRAVQCLLIPPHIQWWGKALPAEQAHQCSKEVSGLLLTISPILSWGQFFSPLCYQLVKRPHPPPRCLSTLMSIVSSPSLAWHLSSTGTGWCLRQLPRYTLLGSWAAKILWGVVLQKNPT